VTIGKLIIPRTLGLAFNQLNYTANLIISSIISTRAITIFNFAQQLQQLPVGIFAATISQASLPTLAEESDREDQLVAFKKTFLTSLHQILFLVLPAAAILTVLRIPVVRLVYGASKFDWPATVETGRTLAFLGVALVAESSVNLLVRGFFALRDSKTPMIIGGIAVLINILFSVAFVFFFFSTTRPVWSLAFAAAVSDISYASMLLFYFSKRVAGFDKQALFLPALKMGLAAIAAGLCLYVPMKLLDQLIFDTTRTVPLLMLTATASVLGLSVYLFFTWLLDIPELRSFTALIGKARRIFFDGSPFNEDELYNRQFHFGEHAFRLLKKGGIYTYCNLTGFGQLRGRFADWETFFRESQLPSLQKIGFTDIQYKIVAVDPPLNHEKYRFKEAMIPIAIR
jgi:putative peptidoglycan lipid II flippase